MYLEIKVCKSYTAIFYEYLNGIIWYMGIHRIFAYLKKLSA